MTEGYGPDAPEAKDKPPLAVAFVDQARERPLPGQAEVPGTHKAGRVARLAGWVLMPVDASGYLAATGARLFEPVS